MPGIFDSVFERSQQAYRGLDDRQRCLFPLPTLSRDSSGPHNFGFSRRQARRRHIRGSVSDICDASVMALNHLYLGSDKSLENKVAPSTAAQREAHRSLYSAARRVGPCPSEFTGEAALKELLAKQGYAGESTTVAPIDIDLLALPRAGFTPISP